MDSKVQGQREILSMFPDKMFWVYKGLPATVKVVACCAVVCWWLILTVYIAFHLQKWWCQVLFLADLYVLLLLFVSVVMVVVVRFRAIIYKIRKRFGHKG